MSLKIHDRPGRISVAEMRRDFESMIKGTPLLRNMPIAVMTINDKFSCYVDADTDAMWIGFALGRRCAERLVQPLVDSTRIMTLHDAACICDASGYETMGKIMRNKAEAIKNEKEKEKAGTASA